MICTCPAVVILSSLLVAHSIATGDGVNFGRQIKRTASREALELVPPIAVLQLPQDANSSNPQPVSTNIGRKSTESQQKAAGINKTTINSTESQQVAHMDSKPCSEDCDGASCIMSLNGVTYCCKGDKCYIFVKSIQGANGSTSMQCRCGSTPSDNFANKSISNENATLNETTSNKSAASNTSLFNESKLESDQVTTATSKTNSNKSPTLSKTTSNKNVISNSDNVNEGRNYKQGDLNTSKPLRKTSSKREQLRARRPQRIKTVI